MSAIGKSGYLGLTLSFQLINASMCIFSIFQAVNNFYAEKHIEFVCRLQIFCVTWARQFDNFLP